ncbi:hypothetical protein RAD15_31745 [Bradyrhizobium sp. 14AA]
MTNWRKSTTREMPKTKAELRQMLTEAVRNTHDPDQAPKRLMKAKEIAAREACVD